MRAVMYVSRSSEAAPSGQVPTAMTGVLLNARRNNSKYEITSFLSFHNGYYLHIVEGPHHAVEALIKNIYADRRHTEIRELVDASIKGRYFDGYPMKLATRSDPCIELVKFLEDFYEHKLAGKCTVAAVVDSAIADESISVRSVPAALVSASHSGFADRSIKLLEWPRFDKIAPTREIMELCAVLIKGEVPYSDLVETNPFPNQEALDEHITRLNELSLLSFKRLVVAPERDTPNSAKPKAGFFKKMKGFLNRLR